ncbi:DUF771 domain-containing protein [Streptococcus agalactiae]|nr:DUF771 domain-containing protein [Streptococcus agalactiae]
MFFYYSTLFDSRFKTLQQNLKDLLGIGRTKLINDILLNPAYKSEIDIALNSKGFVVYPKGKGGRYKILATRARKYFEENFGTILLEI